MGLRNRSPYIINISDKIKIIIIIIIIIITMLIIVKNKEQI